MKKIVVLSNMYPTENHPTFGIFVKNQVKQLKDAGANIEVIAIDEPGKGKFLTLKKYFSWFMKSMIYLLKNKRNISLTHAHYAFPTGVLSLMGKKLFNIPYVVTVHGGDIDKMAEKNKRIKQMTARILVNAERVIAVGERLRNDIVNNFNVPEARVEVLSMGVDTTVFKNYGRAEARQSLGLKNDEKILLFVGNVIQEKGVYELIEAYSQVKKTQPTSALYVLGSERDEVFTRKLSNLVEAEQLTDVYFKQPVAQKELAKWMSAADLLALPSYHEGFGLVALEAMATGTPVVGSDVGGLSYLLADGAGVLVEPKDPYSLAQGFEKVFAQEGFQANQMKQVVQEHSAETILQSLLAIYKDAGR